MWQVRPMWRHGKGGVTVATATIVAVALLLGAGAAHRFYAPQWQMSIDKRIDLPIPLSEIPRQIGRWTGEKKELEESTAIYLKKNFADDYVNMVYSSLTERLGAVVFVVYCATRPAAIVGHKPQTCYPGGGWIWDSTTDSKITTTSGRSIDCLIHCFHRPAPFYQQVYVLNFYVLNGQITLREKDFSGWLGRRPNLNGDPARYVAQVQVSSGSENAIRAVARDVADTILAFLPDKDGRVAAASLFQ